MNKLDLRQVGTLYGLPIYVDLASVPDMSDDITVISERDVKISLVQKTLAKAFGMDVVRPKE